MKIIVCFVFIFALIFVHAGKIKKTERKKDVVFGVPNSGNILEFEGVYYSFITYKRILTDHQE